VKKSVCLVCVLAIWMGAFCTGAAAREPVGEEKKLYAEAQALIDEWAGDPSRLSRAEAIIGRMLSADRNSVPALVASGRLAYKRGYINYDNYERDALLEAKRLFEKAVALDPGFIDVYFYGFRPYLYLKEQAPLKSFVARMKALAPNSPKTHLVLGTLAIYENDGTAAESCAWKVIRGNDDRKLKSDAYTILGQKSMLAKQYDKAEEYLKILLDMAPESPWENINYAGGLIRTRKYGEAIKYAKKALSLMDFGMGHHILGQAYFFKGQELMIEKKKYGDAVVFLNKAIEQDPANANAHFLLGIAYWHVGNDNKDMDTIRDSEAAFKKAIRIDPAHEDAGRVQAVTPS
jgi:tetratricopeptide (TPR) repeat protein